MILLLVMLHQDPDVIQAPRTPAPVCVEFCDAQGADYHE